MGSIAAPSPFIKSMKPGKDVAIMSASSMVTGAAVAIPMTKADMAIR